MIEIPKEYIRDIKIEGLKGRILEIPSQKKSSKKNFFLVHGQHTSHERMYGIALYLSRHGSVYAVDVPGYGGMDSFYKIDKEPTIEAYGHYLFTVMKLLKLDKNVSIIGTSMGFLFVTRMLQLHPQMNVAIKQVFSLVGFTRKKDFAIKQPMWFILNIMTYISKSRLGVWLAETFILNKVSLNIMLHGFAKFKKRMSSLSEDQADVIEMEKTLWTINDHRTHAQNSWDMFHTWDLSIYDPLPFEVVNLTSKADQYFNQDKIAEGMKKTYSEYKVAYLKIDVHSPSIVGSPDDFENAIPSEIRKLIEK